MKLVSFIGGGNNYQLTSVSFSICMLRHSTPFRSYSGNLSAMFEKFWGNTLFPLTSQIYSFHLHNIQKAFFRTNFAHQNELLAFKKNSISDSRFFF